MSWKNVGKFECKVSDLDHMIIDIDSDCDEVIFEINQESVVVTIEEAKNLAMNLLDVCWGEPTTTLPTKKIFQLLKEGEDENEIW